MLAWWLLLVCAAAASAGRGHGTAAAAAPTPDQERVGLAAFIAEVGRDCDAPAPPAPAPQPAVDTPTQSAADSPHPPALAPTPAPAPAVATPTQRRDNLAAKREAYVRLTAGAAALHPGATGDGVDAAHSAMLAAAVIYLCNDAGAADAIWQPGASADAGAPPSDADAEFDAALDKLEEAHGAKGAEWLMEFLTSVDNLAAARGTTDLALAALAAFVAAAGRQPGGAVGAEGLAELLARVQATVPEEATVLLVGRHTQCTGADCDRALACTPALHTPALGAPVCCVCACMHDASITPHLP